MVAFINCKLQRWFPSRTRHFLSRQKRKHCCGMMSLFLESYIPNCVYQCCLLFLFCMTKHFTCCGVKSLQWLYTLRCRKSTRCTHLLSHTWLLMSCVHWTDFRSSNRWIAKKFFSHGADATSFNSATLICVKHVVNIVLLKLIRTVTQINESPSVAHFR